MLPKLLSYSRLISFTYEAYALSVCLLSYCIILLIVDEIDEMFVRKVITRKMSSVFLVFLQRKHLIFGFHSLKGSEIFL